MWFLTPHYLSKKFRPEPNLLPEYNKGGYSLELLLMIPVYEKKIDSPLESRPAL